jgi:hypothetical protein
MLLSILSLQQNIMGTTMGFFRSSHVSGRTAFLGSLGLLSPVMMKQDEDEAYMHGGFAYHQEVTFSLLVSHLKHVPAMYVHR